MAKDKKQDFDAEDFIETMRETAVPTYHRASEKTAPVQEVQTPPEAKADKSSVKGLPLDNDRFGQLELSPEQKKYVDTYMVNNFQQVNRNGRPMVIRLEYIDMIEKKKSNLKVKISTAAYIDNVLTEHFTQQYPQIQGILDKCYSKF